MTSANTEQIQRAQSGDRDAFAQLVEEHYDLMYRVACKFCGPQSAARGDAEDITQQACIKLAKSIGQFRFESAFSTWLYRLVINCAKDWHKAQKATSTEPEQDIAVTNTAEPSVLLHQVLDLMDTMGEGFRETAALVHGEGLSHGEAANILRVKESTISWRLHEIRKRLNAQIPLGSAL